MTLCCCACAKLMRDPWTDLRICYAQLVQWVETSMIIVARSDCRCKKRNNLSNTNHCAVWNAAMSVIAETIHCRNDSLQNRFAACTGFYWTECKWAHVYITKKDNFYTAYSLCRLLKTIWNGVLALININLSFIEPHLSPKWRTEG